MTRRTSKHHGLSCTGCREFPSAIACLEDDLDALLSIHRLAVRHRLVCRTTNLAERSFEEERRRSKVIPRFSDERSAMQLVFATLLGCEHRWNRVSVTDLERRQLDQLRKELDLDPPPAGSNAEKGRGKRRTRREVRLTFTWRSGLDRRHDRVWRRLLRGA